MNSMYIIWWLKNWKTEETFDWKGLEQVWSDEQLSFWKLVYISVWWFHYLTIINFMIFYVDVFVASNTCGLAVRDISDFNLL